MSTDREPAFSDSFACVLVGGSLCRALWTGKAPVEADYLLRAAGPAASFAADALLRASDDPRRDPKLLED